MIPQKLLLNCFGFAVYHFIHHPTGTQVNECFTLLGLRVTQKALQLPL